MDDETHDEMGGDEVSGDEPIDEAFERELALLLADPSLWEEPSGDLEDRVVVAIRAEVVEVARVRSDESGPAAAPVVVPIDSARRRRRWIGTLTAAAVGAAAAAVTVIAVVPRDDDAPSADGTIELNGTDLAPGLGGTADFTLEESGVRIVIQVDGLPRRDGGEFYEGWLKSCDGSELVPIGTFHEVDDAVGWAGVDIATHPILTITREVVAGPKDPAQGSSGEVVVSGALAPCP